MDFKEIILINIVNNLATIKIKVASGAKQTAFYDLMDDNTLKIRVKSIREKGKANKELITYLADFLSVKKDKVTIISGETESIKIIRIDFFGK